MIEKNIIERIKFLKDKGEIPGVFINNFKAEGYGTYIPFEIKTKKDIYNNLFSRKPDIATDLLDRINNPSNPDLANQIIFGFAGFGIARMKIMITECLVVYQSIYVPVDENSEMAKTGICSILPKDNPKKKDAIFIVEVTRDAKVTDINILTFSQTEGNNILWEDLFVKKFNSPEMEMYDFVPVNIFIDDYKKELFREIIRNTENLTKS